MAPVPSARRSFSVHYHPLPQKKEQSMMRRVRNPVHPGEILQEEFLKDFGISQSEFAKHIGVSFQRINEIVNKKRGITPNTAWLFAYAFGTTAQYWMNLQMLYDLATHRPNKSVK